MRVLLLWLLLLLGVWIAGRSWREARVVRKQIFWLGFLCVGVAAAQLLDYEGGVLRWPARAFLVVVTIVAIRQSLRSRWPELRWVAGTGIATILGLLGLGWLSGQMSAATRAAMAAVVVGVALCFIASMVMVALRVAKVRGETAEDPTR
jgi:hypothetical protein